MNHIFLNRGLTENCQLFYLPLKVTQAIQKFPITPIPHIPKRIKVGTIIARILSFGVYKMLLFIVLKRNFHKGRFSRENRCGSSAFFVVEVPRAFKNRQRYKTTYIPW